jgi:osmotically-inducible protein OsmY
MRSDSDIKQDVEAELRWSPDLDDTDIAVKVNGGEVTLSGFTNDYMEKYQAEITVRRIKRELPGLHRVVSNVKNELTVRS